MITIKSSEAATINSEFKEHTAEIKHALDGMLPLLEKDFKIERDLVVLVPGLLRQIESKLTVACTR